MIVFYQISPYAFLRGFPLSGIAAHARPMVVLVKNLRNRYKIYLDRRGQAA
jgi:hypothetical protein